MPFFKPDSVYLFCSFIHVLVSLLSGFSSQRYGSFILCPAIFSTTLFFVVFGKTDELVVILRRGEMGVIGGVIIGKVFGKEK